MGEVVKYHNDVNKIPLGNLTEKELNIFFSLIFKAKEKGTQKIEVTFSELRKLSNGDINNPRFIKAIQSMEDKLIKLSQRVEVEEGKFEVFTLFNRFSLDTKGKTLKIQVNDMFYYMLNDLLEKFTQFDLIELVNCRSSYSKNIFRLLKQWNNVGKLELEIEEFKNVLCVPKSYRMRDIDMRVLIPIAQELRPTFKNLRIEKIKNGRSIKKVLFTWNKMGNIDYKPEEKIKKALKLEISEGLYNIFEKVKKNRFIKPLITTKNMAHLVNEYSELELIEGLNFAYKEIKTEITSINYLIKTINTGITKEEIKIVVKKSESKDLQGVELKEGIKEELTEEIKEPIKTTDKDLEFFREEILKELKNQKTKNKKLKHGQFSVAKVLIGKAQSYEQINELILKYELNEVKN